MEAVWDGDTNTLTLNASSEWQPVDLSATTDRHVIVKHLETEEVTILTPSGGDFAAGEITADITGLDDGRYEAVFRCKDADGDTVTYPSADVEAPQFTIRAAIDA